MPDRTLQLFERLARIESRLEALERAAGQISTKPAEPDQLIQAEPTTYEAVETPAPQPGVLSAAYSNPSERTDSPAPSESDRQPENIEWTPEPVFSERRAKIDWSGVEALVAGRWYALVGGLVVTIGVALFVQFAVSQGWLQQIPGAVRCVLGAGLGVFLLSLGEVARRKLNPWSGVGLTIAGLGSLYASSYAAYALYKLMDPGATLLVLAAVAATGVVISAISGLGVVGVISLIGAYIAPLIASEGDSGYVYLPAYWGALFVVGHGLSVWKGSTFSLCRWLTNVATLAFGAGWIMRFGEQAPRIGLATLASTWLLVHAEAWFTARRADRSDSAELTEVDLLSLLNDPSFFSKAFKLRLRPITSFSVSVWSVVFGVFIAKQTGLVPQSSVPGLTGLAAFILACFMVTTQRVLNPRPHSRVERLASTLVATAGALLVATIAIALSGFAQALAMTMLGLGALGAGRWLRTRVLDLYGALVLVYATIRVLMWDSWNAAPDASGVHFIGFYLTEWTAACAGVGVAWLIYGSVTLSSRRRLQADPAAENLTAASEELFGESVWHHIVNKSLALGFFLLGAALIHQRATEEAVACAAAATTLVLSILAAWRRDNELRIVATLLLFVSTGLSCRVEWWHGLGQTSRVFGLVLRPGMLVPMACGAVALAHARLLSRAPNPWTVARAIAGLGVGLFAAGISHVDSQAASLCVAWLVIDWIVIASSIRASDLSLGVHALLVWFAVLLTWAVKFALDGWVNEPGPPLSNPGLWIAFGLAGTAVGIGRFSTERTAGDRRFFRLLGWWAAAFLIWIATSLEVARIAAHSAMDATSKGAAVSMWWGVFAVALLIVGYIRRNAPARGVALALLALGTAKALLFDLANVSTGWRAVSVVILGMLMVGVGIAYTHINRRLAAAEEPAEPT
ncbi:MAG: DUF2339 domain-containing protein [Phycisphaerales bacterium]|nr:DUF2339 domain-containing protein [Planctomycetota bacterium]